MFNKIKVADREFYIEVALQVIGGGGGGERGEGL